MNPLSWWHRWQKQHKCFHHSLRTYNTDTLQWEGPQSWIKSQLIETGKSKMFWCQVCERTWFA